MTLEDLWKLTRRQFFVIVLCALVGLGVAFGWMALQPKVYTASAAGYVTAGGGTSIGESFSSQTLAQQKAQAYVTLFTNREVTEKVIKELGLDATPQQLASRITASVPEEGVSITVNAEGPSPEEAKDIANAVVLASAAEAKKIEESGPTRQSIGADGKTRTVKS